MGVGHAFTPLEAKQQSSLVGTIWLQFSLDRYMTYSMTRLPLEASGFYQGARQTAVASSSWVKTIADLRRPPWLGSTLGDSRGRPPVTSVERQKKESGSHEVAAVSLTD